MLGLEQKQLCQSARQPLPATCSTCTVFHPHVSLPPFFNYQLSLTASSSTTTARHLQTNHTPSCLHSLLLFLILPFPLCAYSLFLHTLGNDDQCLAIVAQHWYTPIHSLVLFPSTLLTVLYILLSIQCNDAQDTHYLPTPLALYFQPRLLSRDSKCI
jgi:hypothetical protein